MKIRTLLTTLAFSLCLPLASLAQEIIVVGGVKYAVHDVAKGETLYSLARRYGTTVDEIVGANDILAEGLKAGQRIKIPYNAEEKSARHHKVEAQPKVEQSVAEADGCSVLTAKPIQ